MEEFRECVLQAGVADISFRGNTHTWWNKQIDNPISKKLDRILISDQWRLQFPHSYGVFGDPEFSDHCPGCIFTGSSSYSKKYFMIFHFLMDHKDFLPRVKDHWDNTVVRGTKMFQI